MAGGEYHTERCVSPYIFNVVQRIEDPEDIQTILNSLPRKIVDSVITVGYLDLDRSVATTPYSRVTRVTNTVGTAN